MKIKSLRETKKLTQLYVASVVGVTTDTISRWENNRYPTIRRDNAEKLASALEVDLAQILRQDSPEENVQEPVVPPRPSRRLFIVAALVVVVLGAALLLARQLVGVPLAERDLPRYAAPGEVIPVQVKIGRKESAGEGLIVKERLPAGWRLVRAIPAAAGESGTGEVKWLLPAGGGGAMTIYYTVKLPAAAELNATVTFSGEIVARAGGISRKAPSGGDQTVKVAELHWADGNGDGRIDDEEIMPAYYLSEEMKELGLDWKTIERLWSGSAYRWDRANRRFVVVR